MAGWGRNGGLSGIRGEAAGKGGAGLAKSKSQSKINKIKTNNRQIIIN